MHSAVTQGRSAKETRAIFSLGFSSLQPAAAALDALLLVLAGVASIVIYGTPPSMVADMLGIVVIAATIFVALTYLTGGYENAASDTRWRGVLSAWRRWATTICCLALGGFLLKVGAQFSRGTVISFALLGAVAITGKYAIWRFAVSTARDRGLIFVTRVMLLRVRGEQTGRAGDNEAEIRELRRSGLNPVAVQTVILERGEPEWAQTLNFISEQLQLGRIEEIVILADNGSRGSVETVVERLRIFPLPIRLVLDPPTQQLVSRNLRKAGDLVLAEYQRSP